MKTAVIYKSRTGFARRYAELIADQLSADIFSADDLHVEKLFAYDTVVFGGGLYVNGIYGIRKITNNLEFLKDKNIVVFATGAMKESKHNIETIMNANFSNKQLMRIKFFYMQGGFDSNKVSLLDKIFLNIIKLKVKFKKKGTDTQKDLVELYRKNLDVTSKKSTEHIVKYVLGLE